MKSVSYKSVVYSITTPLWSKAQFEPQFNFWRDSSGWECKSQVCWHSLNRAHIPELNIIASNLIVQHMVNSSDLIDFTLTTYRLLNQGPLVVVPSPCKLKLSVSTRSEMELPVSFRPAKTVASPWRHQRASLSPMLRSLHSWRRCSRGSLES